MACAVWLVAGVAVAVWGAGLLGRGGDMAAPPLGAAMGVAGLVPIVLLASAWGQRLGRRLQRREAAARRPAWLTFGLYLAVDSRRVGSARGSPPR